jgi:hypothetical protein
MLVANVVAGNLPHIACDLESPEASVLADLRGDA